MPVATFRDTTGNPITCVCNFAGHPHHDQVPGLPIADPLDEILNTKAAAFGG